MSNIEFPKGDWLVVRKPRVGALPADQQGLVQKFFLWITRRGAKSSTDLNVFSVFARLGAIFPRYLLFLSHILMKGQISREDKERIILRLAWRVGCVYEWTHHVHMARDLGISDSAIYALGEESSPFWDEKTRAYVAAVDELVATMRLSNSAWEALSRQLTQDQLVEFCMLVGHYMMVAVTINTVGIQVESKYLEGAALPEPQVQQ
jgi:4-carboxymuconolactone decarboxylase